MFVVILEVQSSYNLLLAFRNVTTDLVYSQFSAQVPLHLKRPSSPPGHMPIYNLLEHCFNWQIFVFADKLCGKIHSTCSYGQLKKPAA